MNYSPASTPLSAVTFPDPEGDDDHCIVRSGIPSGYGSREAMRSDKMVGQQIRDVRRGQGLTLKQVAGAIGVTAAQLHRYEVGATRIAASRLFSIAEALHVPANTLLNDTQAARPQRMAPPSPETGIEICDLIHLFGLLRSDDERRALLTVARMMVAQSTPS